MLKKMRLLSLSIYYAFCLVVSVFLSAGTVQAFEDGGSLAQEVATTSSRAIYDLDTDQLQAVLGSYLRNNPSIVGLEIFEQ